MFFRDYPDLARVWKIGNSGNSQHIYQIVITSNDQNEKLNVLLIGALRGDEPLGPEVLTRLARHLLVGV